MNEKAQYEQDDEISLLDLMVVIAENWMWLVILPLVLGFITFLTLSLGESQYRASLFVPIAPDQISELWRTATEDGSPVPSLGLAADGDEDGVTIEAKENNQGSMLSLVGETSSSARADLLSVHSFLERAFSAGIVTTPETQHEARISDLEAVIALRGELIATLETRLEAGATDERLEFALTALALAQLLDGRAAELDRLEAFRSDVPSPYVVGNDPIVDIVRLGQSPVLPAALVTLGTGFLMLVSVLVRRGLQQAASDPVAKAKLDRIRNGLLLRRTRS